MWHLKNHDSQNETSIFLFDLFHYLILLTYSIECELTDEEDGKRADIWKYKSKEIE